MAVSPVKPDMTDDKIQHFFDSGSQGTPEFTLGGPSIAMGALLYSTYLPNPRPKKSPSGAATAGLSAPSQ